MSVAMKVFVLNPEPEPDNHTVLTRQNGHEIRYALAVVLKEELAFYGAFMVHEGCPAHGFARIYSNIPHHSLFHSPKLASSCSLSYGRIRPSCLAVQVKSSLLNGRKDQVVAGLARQKRLANQVFHKIYFLLEAGLKNRAG